MKKINPRFVFRLFGIGLFVCITYFANAQVFTGEDVTYKYRPSQDSITIFGFDPDNTLEESFSSFQVYRLNTQAINAYVKDTAFDGRLTLRVNDTLSFDMLIWKNEVRAENFTFQLGDEVVTNSLSDECITYTGILNNTDSGRVALTITPDYFNVMVIQGAETYFFESVQNFAGNAPANEYIFYNAEHNISDIGICGTINDFSVPQDTTTIFDTGGGNNETECTTATIEVAIAIDTCWYNKYKQPNNAWVRGHLESALNNVEGIFNTPTITKKIDFKITKIHVATKASEVPYRGLTKDKAHDSKEVLQRFTSWSSNLGQFDLAQLWVSRDLDRRADGSRTGGKAYQGRICTSQGTQVIASDKAVVIAHETGHSLGYAHDNEYYDTVTSKLYIMNDKLQNPPSVKWSKKSVEVINNTLSTKSCFYDANCAQPEPQICKTPNNLRLINNNQTLTWEAIEGAIGYFVEFRKNNEAAPFPFVANRNSLNIPPSLNPGSYEIRVKTRCSFGESAYSFPIIYTNCQKPQLVSRTKEENGIKVKFNFSNTAFYRRRKVKGAANWEEPTFYPSQNDGSVLFPYETYSDFFCRGNTIQFAVKVVCSSTQESEWSDVIELGPEYCKCEAPKPVVSNITETTAFVFWNSVTGGDKYALKIKRVIDPATAWNTKENLQTEAVLNNLQKNTAYLVSIQAECSLNNQSDWSAPVTFKTLDTPPVSLTLPDENYNFDAPANVQLNAVVNEPGFNPSRAEFYLNDSLIVTDYTKPFSPTVSNLPPGIYTLFVTVWDTQGNKISSEEVTITVNYGSDNPLCQGFIFDPYPVEIALYYPCDSKPYYVPIVNGKAPYRYSWSNGNKQEFIPGSDSGSHRVTVTDANNCRLTRLIKVPLIEKPIITLESVRSAGCSATGGQATIKVDKGNAPFSYNWNNGQTSSTLTGVIAGSYTVTVTDARECTATLGVAITGSSLKAPTGITVNNLNSTSATLSWNDSGGERYKIEYRVGTQINWIFHSNVTVPFVTMVGLIPQRAYQVRITALCGNVNSGPSAIKNFTTPSTNSNKPPIVAITFPANNATYTSSATVNVSATASDPDGTISKVEFYWNNTLLLTDNIAPYNATLSNLAAGTYTLTAKAFDNLQASTTSSAVTIKVNELTNSVCGVLDTIGLTYNVRNCTDFNNACLLSPGSLRIANPNFCLDNTLGTATLTAAIQIAPEVPSGYQIIYILSSEDNRVIEGISDYPDFTVSESGNLRIHTFVYDTTTLDLSGVIIGRTWVEDIHYLLIQGGGYICGALDTEGLLFKVQACTGSLTSKPIELGYLSPSTNTVCINGGGLAFLSASTVKRPKMPEGYTNKYILSYGNEQVINAVSDIPVFGISTVGSYHLHSIIYNPNELDINSIITFGQTTVRQINRLLKECDNNTNTNTLVLNGTSDHKESPISSSYQTIKSFTLETWVKFNNPGVGTNDFIAEVGNSNYTKLWFWYNNDNTFGLPSKNIAIGYNGAQGGFNNGPDFMYDFSPQAGTWYHLAFSYNNSTRQITLYINGASRGSRTVTGNAPEININNLKLYLGKRIFGGIYSHFFDGQMDDFRMWNYARSASEITSNYKTELTGKESGLVAYYKFDETSAGTNKDCSANQLHLAQGTSRPPLASTVSNLSDVSCGISSNLTDEMPALLQTKELEFDGISVYPNPTSGVLNIAVNNQSDIPSEWVVQDATGRIIHIEKRAIAQDVQQDNFVIDLSRFSNGLYFLSAHMKNKIIVRKLVITK